jgi:hypothetical protein
MKQQQFLTRLFACVCLAAMVTFAACKKETSASNSTDEKEFAVLSAGSNTEASTVFDDVFNNVLGVNAEVAYGGIGVFGRIITVDSLVNPCFTVRITRLNAPSSFPVKVEVDFGTGCIGNDGTMRKGKITIIYSGRLALAGSTAETSFDTYYVNNIRVEGSHHIENISTPQQLVFKVTVKDGKLTKANSNYSLWNSIYTISQIEGSTTPYWAKDDVFSITGDSNGTLKTDSTFLVWATRIEEPLIKKFSCRWIVKGRLAILKTNTVAAIIDFGDGSCNNKANLIINTLSLEITLH